MVAKKAKTEQRGVSHEKCEASNRFVLVGTYKGDQLTKWRGWYNYPISDEELSHAETQRRGENELVTNCDKSLFSKINELWLFNGTKDERRYGAEFVGVKTRKELIDNYGYPAKGKAHGEKYLLFKTAYKYRHSGAVPEDAARVIVRAADFAKRSPKIAKQLKAYLESPDRNDPDLAKRLPEIITRLRPEQLRVCEAAVQLTFFSMLETKVEKLPSALKDDRPIAIDLFAGCGGLSLGFEQSGFDVVAAVEIDPIHAAVHEYNFPNCKTICADIKNIDGNDIRQLAGIGNRDVDVVVGGAPCQGFSMIGKRALDDPRNQLISHYLRIVKDIRPKYCVLENVKGLTVGKHAQFLAELISELKKIHYKVLLPYQVLNAADFGVPQNRERLFLIAARDDQALANYPTALERRVTIEDAISDLPDADRYDCLLSDDSVSVHWKTSRAYAQQLRGLLPDDSNFGYDRSFDRDKLTSSRRTIHGAVSMARFMAAPQGETEPHSRFFKLAWAGQANTLRAGTDSARGGFTSPRPIHPTLPRVITVREAARIHSYPDWFRFNKTKWHGFREIGNSVPPKLARAVGSMVITALGVTPIKPTSAIKPGSEALLEFDMRAAADHFEVPRNVIAQRKRKCDGKKNCKN